MRSYRMTPSEVARTLASGGAVPAGEVPYVTSAIGGARTLRADDMVVVDGNFADGYGLGRRYRSMATLALHMGCPMVCVNPIEWFVRESRALWEARRN